MREREREFECEAKLDAQPAISTLNAVGAWREFIRRLEVARRYHALQGII